jgi:chemotaxis protein CheD
MHSINTRTQDEVVVGRVESDMNGRPTVYLHPGQIFVSSEPYVVSTILGSCVAVCLWDPLLKAGGANHFLLPYQDSTAQTSTRFGNTAVKVLVGQLLAMGSAKKNLRAKLFGGACVIAAFREKADHLGMKNIQVARQLLEDENIPLINADVGGWHGRKLIFRIGDGAAWVKRL